MSSFRLILAFAALALTGCAYFNTFYFAKKHFAAAERIRERAESGPQVVEPTAGTPSVSPEAVQRYDDAILQCKKVLNFHEGSRWTDDAIFLMGASYYGKAAYDSALATLDGFVQGFPESDFLARAHYYRGLSFFERGRYDEMAQAFDAALAADPELEERDDILFTRARAAEEQGDRDEAVGTYRALVAGGAGKERSEDALLEIGRLYFEAGLYDSALVAYNELAEGTKDQHRYEEAQLQIGESLVRLGRAREAIARLERQVPREEPEARTPSDFPARVRLGLAQAYNREGRHGEAIDVLRKVVDAQRSSPYSHEAQYQIAYTYEVYMDSLDAAEREYEEAARMNFRPAFRDLAKTRVIDLRKLKALASAETAGEDADREKRASAALQIAELYYYSKRDVPAALEQYAKVIDEYGDTGTAARAAYAQAWIQLQEETLADEDGYAELRELVARYPASSQARAAIELLVKGQQDTTGLGALLIEPEPVVPEPAPVATAGDSLGLPDSLGSVDPIRRFSSDSLSILPDSLSLDRLGGRFAGRDSLLRESPDALRTSGDSLGAAGDSLEAGRADSVGVTPLELPEAAPDSAGQEPPHRRLEP